MLEYTTRLLAATVESGCTPSKFFGLPPWYEYLDVQKDALGKCVPTISWNINELWLIGLAVVDILLRVAGMVAIGFIIYGGVQYMLSSGEPDKTKNARNTIINALVGLVIAIIAVPIVSFIGNSIK